MPVSPTYPGVYVQEVPSGVRTITGVATSIGMFIGASTQGPIGEPIECLNYTSFKNQFGEDSSVGQLAQYVKLFFLNGGTDCYVMRIAGGAGASKITLRNELNNSDVLRLEAKEEGVAGENIRALVTYNGAQPEVTFNLELFQWQLDSSGNQVATQDELWRNLSMDPNSPTYAPTFISQNSALVNGVELIAAPAAGTVFGFLLSGRAVPDVAFATDWGALLGSTATTNRFQISLSGSPYIDVDLSGIVVTTQAALETEIANAIQQAFAAKGIPGVTVSVTFPATTAGRRLRVDRTGTNGDVFIRPGTKQGAQGDLAVPLMLGTAQGGLEVSGFADHRPAPTGITFRAADAANLTALGDLQQGQVTSLTLDLAPASGAATPQVLSLQPAVVTTAAGDLVAVDGFQFPPTKGHDGVREKLAIIAAQVNGFAPPSGSTRPWTAAVWGYRLALLPTAAAADNFLSSLFAFTTGAALPATAFTKNVHLYTLGQGGQGIGLQDAGVLGADGGPPAASDYDDAYVTIDKEVDLFNLMVLPPVENAVAPVEQLYGNASVFCQQRRAFLLMDPPTAASSVWTDAQSAATKVAQLRVGLVKDYSAVFFPRLTVNDNGLQKPVGPAGAIAGLCARIDGQRGVWKAPAGTEADVRGIVGLDQRFSDGENGLLNPRAINTLRIFPAGIVNWGARTNDGDDNFQSEYKYIPVRRLALYMEESLYRGLQWVVFEPNDEPLWSQIRLNVGSFMQDLFRQGAFQGATPSVAYFVKCDSETTTANDQDLGLVNVWVGFAPLKPAEFVILYLQQMAGQVQV